MLGGFTLSGEATGKHYMLCATVTRRFHELIGLAGNDTLLRRGTIECGRVRRPYWVHCAEMARFVTWAALMAARLERPRPRTGGGRHDAQAAGPALAGHLGAAGGTGAIVSQITCPRVGQAVTRSNPQVENRDRPREGEVAVGRLDELPVELLAEPHVRVLADVWPGVGVEDVAFRAGRELALVDEDLRALEVLDAAREIVVDVSPHGGSTRDPKLSCIVGFPGPMSGTGSRECAVRAPSSPRAPAEASPRFVAPRLVAEPPVDPASRVRNRAEKGVGAGGWQRFYGGRESPGRGDGQSPAHREASTSVGASPRKADL